MQQMSEAVWQLVIVGGLLGVLIGFFIAFLAAEAVYWRTWRKTQMGVSTPRVTPRQLRRLRRLGICRNPGGVRWVTDWYVSRSRIGDPGLMVKEGAVLVVDASDLIVAWLPSPFDKEGTVSLAEGYRCLTANDGKPTQVYNTLGGGGAG